MKTLQLATSCPTLQAHYQPSLPLLAVFMNPSFTHTDTNTNTHTHTNTQVTSMKTLQLATSCPTALKKFISRCLNVKAQERPSFAEILPMLDELEDELVGTF